MYHWGQKRLFCNSEGLYMWPQMTTMGMEHFGSTAVGYDFKLSWSIMLL